ncbi:MAG TPA: 6-phosphogluconolactonase [Terriglobales bacterium]|nr:6-phosphogluconolactonase [Terriglobales bacterium]
MSESSPLTRATAFQNSVQIIALPDAPAVARRAAEMIVHDASEAIAAREQFLFVLAGGTAPRPTYEQLAKPECSSRVDWKRTHVFWGDERYVPPTDPQSNFRMCNETLVRHVPLSESNVHRVPTEVSPADAAASAYEQEVRRVTGTAEREWPRFDVVLLGLGTNGHTASLFPHSPVLRERSRLVAADFVAEVNAWRITMTVPVLNQAHNTILIATGKEKAEVVRDVITGAREPERLPAQFIHPVAGTLTWLLDKASAALLPAGVVKTAAE